MQMIFGFLDYRPIVILKARHGEILHSSGGQ